MKSRKVTGSKRSSKGSLMWSDAKAILAIATVAIAGLIGIFIIISRNNSAASLPASSANPLIGPSPHTTGSGTKVTVVEFGDYQCPACLEDYPVAKQIIADYSSRITFVFRNYPLPQHANAPAAAEVAEAAAAQGKFWQMHDKLYDTQNDWANLSSADALRQFLSYANDLGIDANKVNDAVENNTYHRRIAQDQADGNTLHITGVPTFFVNGKMLPGLPDYAALSAAINADLKS